MTQGDPRRADRAIIYRSELDFVCRCILDRPNIETGGQLFGFWTAGGIPVVLYALGPGPKANHQIAFFNQDIDYLQDVGRMLYDKYGLLHIGEWHSHHQLGLAHPSGHDADTMASSIANKRLGRFLMVLGNCSTNAATVRAFEFVEGLGSDWRQLPWSVKEIESPFRTAIAADQSLSVRIVNPQTVNARYEVNYA